MAHNSFPKWSEGNDGFGYPEPQRFDETPFLNPVIEAEARGLINMVANRCLHRLEREEAYKKLVKQCGAYLQPDDAEWYCSRDTESEESGSDASGSDASDSDSSDDAELFCSRDTNSESSDLDSDGSDGSGSDDSEQCPEKSSDAVASQSMGQHLSPDKTDSKGE